MNIRLFRGGGAVILILSSLCAVSIGSTTVAAQAVRPAAVDTVFQASVEQVVAAVAATLSSREMLGALSETELTTAVTEVVEQETTAGIRGVSIPVDSLELAQWVLPEAVQYIGPTGGRYLIDIVITLTDAAGTRFQMAPLFVSTVPGSENPLGGRPLPSSGLLERQTLEAVANALSGGGEVRDER